ncbi:hypothetical protein GCM10009765_06310 [Fodinicola feengrottensis]|uniref:ABC3 transporter permease C-terminal domain-containing protein n=2 Tax=Fodinicola feengrottensis TaxID=435914 RepID=A0ABP4RQD2_9ACTN
MTAAVVGPAYARAAEQSLLVSALRAAPASIVGIRVSSPYLPLRYVTAGSEISIDAHSESPAVVGSEVANAGAVDPLLAKPVGGLEMVAGFTNAKSELVATTVVYRDGACAHLRIVAGTCDIDSGVVISKRSAATTGMHVGSKLDLKGLKTAGSPKSVPVTGLYEPVNPEEPYWLAQPYFDFRLVNLDRETTIQGVDAVFGGEHLLGGLPGELTVVADVAMRVDQVRLDDIDRLLGKYAGVESTMKGSGYAVSEQLQTVVDPVTVGRRLVALSIPLVAAELVLIAWFVLMLVVSDATDVRGPEIALARLRGHRGRSVTAFGLAESLLLVLAAGPVGLLLGLLATELVARGLLASGIHVELRLPVWVVAGLALAGALVAAAIAGRRVLGLSVADLLRRVPARRHGLRAGIADGIVVALAVAALVQLLTDRGRSASPLALVAPAMVAVVMGIGAARLLPLLARWQRITARTRANLVGMLGWTPLERRASGRRSILVVTVAVALLFFSSIAWDTAASDRQARAAAEVGADRVLTVRASSELDLLQAVRKADPTGQYAMAAVQFAVGQSGSVNAVLGVDSSRLAAVARWDRGGLTEPVAAIAQALSKPAPATPLLMHGPELALRVVGDQLKSARPLTLEVSLRDNHGQPVNVPMGALRQGAQTLRAPLPGCAAGCRFDGLQIQRDPLDLLTISGQVQVTGLTDGGSPVTGFAAANGWRTPDSGLSSPHATLSGDSTLTVSFNSDGGEQIYAARADTPSPIPAVLAGTAPPPVPAEAPTDSSTDVLPAPPTAAPDPDSDNSGLSKPGSKVAGPDFSVQTHTYLVAAHADYVPSVSGSVLMADLAYLDRVSNTYGRVSLTDEVWLAPDAPASVLKNLSAAGIETLSETTYAGRLAQLDGQGPTLALRMYLVAAVAALLLAGGAIVVAAYLDGRVRAYEFGVLRLTGVSDQVLRGAARLEQLAPALAGVVAGLVAGGVGAALALPAIPVFSDPPPFPRLVYLPGPAWPLGAAMLAAAVLTVVALLVAVRSERGGTIRRVQEGQQ